jgi:hypothetical protein
MAKKIKPIFWVVGIGAVVGVLALIRKGVGLSKLQWYSKGLKIKSGKLDYKVEIINPTNTIQKIDNVFLNFYSGNTRIGKIFINSQTIIPKNNKIDVSIPIEVNVGGVALLIADVIKYKSLSITITGSVTANGVPLPVNELVNFNLSDYIP